MKRKKKQFVPTIYVISLFSLVAITASQNQFEFFIFNRILNLYFISLVHIMLSYVSLSLYNIYL